jgi:hypothetical protein
MIKLGDLVYYFTYYTGIRWLVKKITKWYGIEDCGCDRRRNEWNDIEINLEEKWKNWID